MHRQAGGSTLPSLSSCCTSYKIPLKWFAHPFLALGPIKGEVCSWIGEYKSEVCYMMFAGFKKRLNFGENCFAADLLGILPCESSQSPVCHNVHNCKECSIFRSNTTYSLVDLDTGSRLRSFAVSLVHLLLISSHIQAIHE